MNDQVRILNNHAMGQLMKRKAKTHGCFFTQEEFEENKKEIFEITKARRKLWNYIKENEKDKEGKK